MSVHGNIVPTVKKPTMRRPSLVVNAISNWGALGINVLVGFLLTPYIIRCLGTAQYGIWILIASVIGYYGLLDLGVSSAIMRYVARYAGQKDYESLNKVVNTALVIFSVIGCIVIIVSILLAEPLAHFFNVENSDFASFKLVIRLLGISAGLMLPGNVLLVIILAHEHFVIANIIRIIVILLRSGLYFFVLYTGGGLVGMGWINGGISIFMIVVYFAIVKLYFKHISFSLRMASKSSVRALFTFGIFASIIHLGNMLRLKFSAVVIGKFMNMDAVGIYGVSALLFGYVSRSVISCSGVTQPRLSSLAGTNDLEFRDAVLRYSKFVAVLAAGVGAVSISLAYDFMELWLPDNVEDIKGVTTVFIVLSIGLVPELMTEVSKNALQAVKKHPYYAYQTVIEGIINVILSILLVFKYGIYGVALGVAIPSLITKLIIQPVYCCRILKIDWATYMLQVLVKPLLVAGFVVWLIEGSELMFHATSYMQLILKSFLAILLYAVGSYIFCLDSQNRRLVWAHFKTSRICKVQS